MFSNFKAKNGQQIEIYAYFFIFSDKTLKGVEYISAYPDFCASPEVGGAKFRKFQVIFLRN